MANEKFTPRIEDLDVPFISDRLEDRIKAKAEAEQSIREEPNKFLQTKINQVFMDCEDIGFYEFGLGYPAKKVRQAFAEAAAACLKVFELRGTEEPFPVVVLTVDPTKSERDPAFVTGERSLHPPGARDFSRTNSHDCFRGICIALVSGELTIANKLAALMWDPPNARYIGRESEVCTTNQQHLAYAVKHLLQNNLPEMAKELQRVVNRKGQEEVPAMAKMVRTLAEKHDGLFIEGLLELLFWHAKEAKKPP